jgi:hypothetical protein
VTNSFQEHDQQSFWSQVFDGAPPIQFTRAFAYGLLALFGVIAIGLLIAGICLYRALWKKAKRRQAPSALVCRTTN